MLLVFTHYIEYIAHTLDTGPPEKFRKCSYVRGDHMQFRVLLGVHFVHNTLCTEVIMVMCLVSRPLVRMCFSV